jgi:hypothetical protein
LPEQISTIARLLNQYSFIAELKIAFDHSNREGTLEAARQLKKRVASDKGKRIVDSAIELLLSPKAWAVHMVGAMAEAHPNEAYQWLSDQRFFDYLEEEMAPSYWATALRPFMLFPGGDIVPFCTFESPHIRSIGNIFHQTPEEILRRFEEFRELFWQLAVVQEEYLPLYDALIKTEEAMRSRYGITGKFATHFRLFPEGVA